MAEIDSSPSSGKNFFSTLPGIITATAGLITAVGGFILILSKTGCMDSKVSYENKVVQNDTLAVKKTETLKDTSVINSENITYSPSEIKHITRYITYNILQANITKLPDKEIVFSLKLKCINDSKYEYNFYAKYIRARIGKDYYPPDPYSPSEGYEAVSGNGFKNLEYNYKLPAGIKNFILVFFDENTEIGSASFTLK